MYPKSRYLAAKRFGSPPDTLVRDHFDSKRFGEDTAGRATLTAGITTDPTEAITRDTIAFTVQVNNTSGATALSITATLTLNALFTWVSSVGAGWVLSRVGNVITATLASLAPNASATAVVITATTADVGSEGGVASTLSVACVNADTVTDSETTKVHVVARDATSLIRVPESTAEWTDFINRFDIGVAVPGSVWLCQEASGNLADSISSVTLTGAGATRAYQQAISGWTRLGVKVIAALSVDKFVAGSGVGPNPSTTSVTMLAIVTLPATPPSGDRSFIGFSLNNATTGAYLLHRSSTGVLRYRVFNVNVSGAVSHSAATHAFVITYNRTAGTAKMYSELEKIIGTYNAGVPDGDKGIASNSSALTSDVRMAYAAMWSGAGAEMTDGDVSTLLNAMGYSVPW